jgi:hypothetical protein
MTAAYALVQSLKAIQKTAAELANDIIRRCYAFLMTYTSYTHYAIGEDYI